MLVTHENLMKNLPCIKTEKLSNFRWKRFLVQFVSDVVLV